MVGHWLVDGGGVYLVVSSQATNQALHVHSSPMGAVHQTEAPKQTPEAWGHNKQRSQSELLIKVITELLQNWMVTEQMLQQQMQNKDALHNFPKQQVSS